MFLALVCYSCNPPNRRGSRGLCRFISRLARRLLPRSAVLFVRGSALGFTLSDWIAFTYIISPFTERSRNAVCGFFHARFLLGIRCFTVMRNRALLVKRVISEQIYKIYKEFNNLEMNKPNISFRNGGTELNRECSTK